MDPSSAVNHGYSLLLIEAGVTVIGIAVAFCFPGVLAHPFARAESLLRGFACRKRLAVATVGMAMLLLRLAMLPWFPPPQPFSTDDFSFLLAADTFAHGRLTNPTPVMWTHFESIHITMQPTYMSMYFPGQGLIMAAGQVVFGHPWAGILIVSAMMCAGLCWMLQGWLPPGWALLGGVIAIVRIGLFSYWVNTYTGGATLSALGGAMVLGALPRLMRTARFRYGMIMAVGMVLLAMTRPYEGVLVCLPVVAVLSHWALYGKNRPHCAVLLRRAAVPVALIAAALIWMAYYDARNFGNPRTLPYTVARASYAVVPYYIWQPAHPLPAYRHNEIKRFYTESEMVGFNQLHSFPGFITRNLGKLITTIMFFAGWALLPAIVMTRRVFADRRVRFLAICVPFWIVGMAIGVFLIPHYLAPFTAAVYALGLQGLRHLRALKVQGQFVGRTSVRLLASIVLLMGGLRLVAEPLQLVPPQWPIGPWLCTWIGPGHFGAARAAVATQLEHMPGKHLVFVRYSPRHEPGDEWVYNAADVDGSRVIWAREMNQSQDDALMRFYHDRDVWLVQPDLEQGRLAPDPRANYLRAAQ